MMKTKLFALLALALCAGALPCVPAYASAEEPAAAAESVAAADAETLTVNAVWLEGDTLHIDVTDRNSGADQALTLDLKDYAGANDEFVTVQAIDRAGNKSNTIRFKNPFYRAPAELPASSASPEPSPGQSESGVPSGSFTPDGAGTVLDNAASGEAGTSGAGKEFFTIQSEDGAVFYLIIDRERTQDNVYFLNAVTEGDLLSLAKPGDGTGESGVPANPTSPQTVTPAPEPGAEPSPPPVNSGGGMNTGAFVFIIIAALAAGGAGYYFKILRPKQRGAAPEEDYEEGDYGDADDDGDPADGEDEDE